MTIEVSIFQRTRTTSFSCLFMLLLIAGLAQSLQAQEVIGGDLQAPTSVILTPQGGQLVTENGRETNGGRVTFFKHTGQRFVLIDGLPSGMGPEGFSGPSAVALDGLRLFIVIGEGDVRGVPEQGQPAIPNPNGLSSPLFSSVLCLRLPRRIDQLNSGFHLTLEDQLRVADGLEVILDGGGSLNASIKLMADIQDLIPDPVTHLRASNPFGIQVNYETFLFSGQLPTVLREIYVNDASRNTLFKVGSGRPVAVARFAPIPNPLNFGPPVSEPVPTSVRRLDRGHLLVTLLAGFPFAAGTAQVRLIDLKTRANEPFIEGLTSAIDLQVVKDDEGTHFLVLEFSNNLLQNGPGRVLWFDTPDSEPIVVADGLVSPTGMARDADTGRIYISQIFPGLLVAVDGPND